MIHRLWLCEPAKLVVREGAGGMQDADSGGASRDREPHAGEGTDGAR